VKSLPPPEYIGPDLDLGTGLPEVMDAVLARGNEALQHNRETKRGTRANWAAAGAAWDLAQRIAMHRSNSNQPSGRRYAAVLNTLEHPYSELQKADRKTRNDAIWYFRTQSYVDQWLAGLSQSQRDKWTHPTVIRRHYEARYGPAGKKTGTYKRRPRHHRAWNTQALGERAARTSNCSSRGWARNLPTISARPAN
jgi:hypothetical protein